MANDDVKFYLGHDPSSNFKTIVENAERDASKYFKEMKSAKDNESYALSALNGGDKSRFADKASVTEFYGRKFRDHQSNVITIRDQMVKKLRDTMATYLKIDVDEIAEMNAALSVINNDDMLIRYLADPLHRHYSHYLAIAAYAKDHKESKVARTIATHMNELEKACEGVIKRGEGVYINDRFYDGSWLGWVELRINEVTEACDNLEKAADGKTVDGWTSLSAGVF